MEISGIEFTVKEELVTKDILEELVLAIESLETLSKIFDTTSHIVSVVAVVE